MSNLAGKAFWVILFLIFTFAFTVLFDHGPDNFVENAQKDFESLKQMVIPDDGKAKDKKKP